MERLEEENNLRLQLEDASLKYQKREEIDIDVEKSREMPYLVILMAPNY